MEEGIVIPIINASWTRKGLEINLLLSLLPEQELSIRVAAPWRRRPFESGHCSRTREVSRFEHARVEISHHPMPRRRLTAGAVWFAGRVRAVVGHVYEWVEIYQCV